MLSHSSTPFAYCFSNPDARLLSQLFTRHCTFPSDHFHSVAPSFPLQHFTRSPSPWPPHRTLSYLLSNPRTSSFGRNLPKPLFHSADLFTTPVSLAWPRVLHIFLPLNPNNRAIEETHEVHELVFSEKQTQIDRPESSGRLYGFSAWR